MCLYFFIRKTNSLNCYFFVIFTENGQNKFPFFMQQKMCHVTIVIWVHNQNTKLTLSPHTTSVVSMGIHHLSNNKTFQTLTCIGTRTKKIVMNSYFLLSKSIIHPFSDPLNPVIFYLYFYNTDFVPKWQWITHKILRCCAG